MPIILTLSLWIMLMQLLLPEVLFSDWTQSTNKHHNDNNAYNQCNDEHHPSTWNCHSTVGIELLYKKRCYKNWTTCSYHGHGTCILTPGSLHIFLHKQFCVHASIHWIAQTKYWMATLSRQSHYGKLWWYIHCLLIIILYLHFYYPVCVYAAELCIRSHYTPFQNFPPGILST